MSRLDKLMDDIDANPERRKRVENLEQAYLDASRLTRMREDRGVTQVDLARVLDVSQANISQLENRGRDLYLSTLAGYVNALGGTLRIEAIFPEATYQLVEIEPTGEAASHREGMGAAAARQG